MSEDKRYKIVRFYASAEIDPSIISTGLTLAEAQAHCNDPETSSETATSADACKRTRIFGRWFDGYEEEV